MKLYHSILIVPALLLGACGGGESSASEGDAEGFDVPENVITPDEADEKAKSEITADNADEEYEKLKEDIGG